MSGHGGGGAIVFSLMRSLWYSTRKRHFCPEGSCQVSGLLKTVSPGYQPSQLSVLNASDGAQICPRRPHMQAVSVLGHLAAWCTLLHTSSWLGNRGF